MPLVRWLATVLRASFWLLVNLAIAGGLFVASAALFTRTDDDFRVPATIVRTIGAVWLYAAVWTWAVRGVLMRPAPASPQKKKPTGAEVARGTAGCVGNLVVVALAWVIVGQVADWAVAGVAGPDPQHPARLVADRALGALQVVASRPDVYLPRIVGGLIAFLVITTLLSRLSGSPPVTRRQAEAALRTARQKGRGKVPSGASPSQIPTRAGAAVEQAHGNAHRASRSGGSREDGVLGTMRYNAADGGWWARQGSEAFPVRIEAEEDGPSAVQLDLARALVQRSFEAQLRAADAARTAAQARGIGLPRFTIAAASVGPDAGGATPITLRLHCDGDAQHQYTVRSTNALQSFTSA